MTSMDDSYDLNMAAAMLRSNSTDLRLLLKALCEELSDTLGDRLRVQRGGSRFKKSEAISSVQITMASDQFEAVIDGRTFAARSDTSRAGFASVTKTLTSTYGSSNFSGHSRPKRPTVTRLDRPSKTLS